MNDAKHYTGMCDRKAIEVKGYPNDENGGNVKAYQSFIMYILLLLIENHSLPSLTKYILSEYWINIRSINKYWINIKI